MKRDKITIVVADDHPFFREGLIKVLEFDKRFIVLEEAKNGEELISKVKYLKPDLAIADVTMPIKNGIEATKEIKDMGMATEIIALSMHNDEKLILQMLQAGAMGFLEKNISKEELYRAIETVIEDRRVYFPESTSRKMFQLIQQSTLKPFGISSIEFTSSEIEIIQWVCKDLSNKEIGEQLNISSRTVEGKRDRIMKKMNVRSVAGLVAFAYSNGIVIEGLSGGGSTKINQGTT
jgi:DNA-binding NarL/FixJ family response regulator